MARVKVLTIRKQIREYVVEFNAGVQIDNDGTVGITVPQKYADRLIKDEVKNESK